MGERSRRRTPLLNEQDASPRSRLSEAAGVDDPRAMQPLAVRFSAPLFPGDTVTTRVWRVEGGYGFGAYDYDGQGTTVIKDGLAQLADPATRGALRCDRKAIGQPSPGFRRLIERPWDRRG